MKPENIKNDFETLSNCLEIPTYSKAKESLDRVNDEFGMKLWLQRNYRVPDTIKKTAERIANESYSKEDVKYVANIYKHLGELKVAPAVFTVLKERIAMNLSYEYDERNMARWKLVSYISKKMFTAARALEKVKTKEELENWFRQNHSITVLGYIDDFDLNNIDKENVCNDLNEAASLLDSLLDKAEHRNEEAEEDDDDNDEDYDYEEEEHCLFLDDPYFLDKDYKDYEQYNYNDALDFDEMDPWKLEEKMYL